MISREAPLSVFDIVYVQEALFVLFHIKVFLRESLETQKRDKYIFRICLEIHAAIL